MSSISARVHRHQVFFGPCIPASRWFLALAARSLCCGHSVQTLLSERVVSPKPWQAGARPLAATCSHGRLGLLTATAGRRVRGERHCAAGGPRSSRCRLAACSVCAGPTMRAFARSAAVLRREPQLGVMAQQPRLRCCAVLRSSYNRRAARWRNVLCAAAAMVGLRGAAMCCAALRLDPRQVTRCCSGAAASGHWCRGSPARKAPAVTTLFRRQERRSAERRS